MKRFTETLRFIGIQSDVVSSEKVVAAIGGTLAILLTYALSVYLIGPEGSIVILPSMGASTVLLFAVPHGQLSTPWALFGGNLISAFAGVTMVKLVPDIYLAAALAVGTAILFMHLARCLHPPGGATALAAAIGGPSFQELGYWYMVTPTLMNCLILFLVAVVFNNRFHWRRYPMGLMKYQEVKNNPDTKRILPKHIHQAISQSEVVVDISDQQLKRIIDLADEIMRAESALGFELEVGAFYTNSLPGMRWSVRQVVDERAHKELSKYMVVYRTVEGANKGHSDSCSLLEFADWATEKLQPSRRPK